MKKIAVIGAGIAGTTTAYALVKRGFDVTVIDSRRYPAMA
ncbi:MAG: FAD-dependent oxidoreductase, partial [SAR86 cluster bacterium]|nr:FAD-dependent oxidoreductase [SAR86 cluster bacterium]